MFNVIINIINAINAISIISGWIKSFIKRHIKKYNKEEKVFFSPCLIIFAHDIKISKKDYYFLGNNKEEIKILYKNK